MGVNYDEIKAIAAGLQRVNDALQSKLGAVTAQRDRILAAWQQGGGFALVEAIESTEKELGIYAKSEKLTP